MIGLRELAILAWSCSCCTVVPVSSRAGGFRRSGPGFRPSGGSSKPDRINTAFAPPHSHSRPRPPCGPKRDRQGKPKLFVLRGNRLFWFLTILAATAVAAVIVGRMMIASGAGPGLSH